MPLFQVPARRGPNQTRVFSFECSSRQEAEAQVRALGWEVEAGQESGPGTNAVAAEEALGRLASNTRRKENEPIRIPIWLFIAVVVLIGWAASVWYEGLGVADIPLCVVNTSSSTPLSIRLDGKSIGLAPKMVGEDPKAAIIVVLGLGAHELEAQDSAGKVLAHDKFVVEKGSHGFLWTPLPDPAVNFQLQTTEYGEVSNQSGGDWIEPLEPGGPLRAFPKMVTQWFHDNPKSVVVQKWAKSDFERALRRAK